ncbi:MAG: hypothetical protein NVS1B6_16570 [Steroidobacteraceae bacterium]
MRRERGAEPEKDDMNEAMQQLAGGQLNAVTITIWTLLAFVLATAGGAFAGVQLGGKDLGNGLAAAMGAMYGPVAAVPAVLAGLLILALI